MICSIDVSPWLKRKIKRVVDEVCSVEYALFILPLFFVFFFFFQYLEALTEVNGVSLAPRFMGAKVK